MDTADGGGGAGTGIDALPGDIYVVVLRRLSAHSLARCRCVRALWRALVDGSGLLLPHALPPRAFPGFFANARAKPWRRPHPGFLPPPASRAPARDRLAFLRPHLPCAGAAAAVQHQCNGLVLCFVQDYLAGVGFVCNPVTERWARLPPPPTWWPRRYEGLFLAFDPAVSLDYEVLFLPVPPPRQSNGDAGLRQGHVTLGMFMPESFGKPQEPDDEKLLPLLAFSSATGRWTNRLLTPGRCAPARLYDRVMRRRRRSAEGGDPWARTWRSSALYRRGSLYAHCEKGILVVLHCSEGTYDMVKLPAVADAGAGAGQGERYAAGHVLSSLPVDSIFPGTEDGVLVRYASADAFRVRVWALHESAGDGGGRLLEWTLTHDTDLAAHARMLDLLHHAPSNCVPLAPEESTGRGSGKCVWFSDEDGEEAAGNGGDVGHGCTGFWNWDDASLLDMDIGADELIDVGAGAPSPFSILGCHPDKEVVYLAAGAFHVVAYHLGSAKVQYLGRVMSLGDGDRLDGVFPYRPCIVDALPHDSCLFPSLKSAVIKSQ
ncbi:hypothetical protein SETIT_7G108200v2 [Setaria italica]|uniref:F-box domain-containing protein n=2 Tax=Setaria italica TaxID=4555 RepID=A0A368RUE4_SETIT|nr:uncharacterized protein LOC101781430 [Setaria italica]RCV33758.1 hypothetical protein SETIT_7G108200v2 [Setaria italica]